MLRILCFNCGHENLAANDTLGRTVTCAKCGHRFVADDDVTVYVDDSSTAAKTTAAAAPTPPPPPVEPPPIVVATSPPGRAAKPSKPRRSIYKRLIVIATVLWLPACGAMYLYRATKAAVNRPADETIVEGAINSLFDEWYIWEGVQFVTVVYAVVMVALVALHFATRPDRLP